MMQEETQEEGTEAGRDEELEGLRPSTDWSRF